MLNRLTTTATVWFFGLALAMAWPLALCNRAAAVIVVNNPSFETNTGNGIYTGQYTIANWTFASSVTGAWDGLSPTGLASMAAPPDGAVAAFLEQGGTFSQSLSGFLSAPTYTISLQASYSSQTGALPITVTIDSTVVNFGGNPALSPASSTWAAYTSDPFSVTAGTHTLTFTGNASLDRVSFIDQVAVNEIAPAPEPASVALVALGGVALLRRRR